MCKNLRNRPSFPGSCRPASARCLAVPFVEVKWANPKYSRFHPLRPAAVLQLLVLLLKGRTHGRAWGHSQLGPGTLPWNSPEFSVGSSSPVLAVSFTLGFFCPDFTPVPGAPVPGAGGAARVPNALLLLQASPLRSVD